MSWRIVVRADRHDGRVTHVRARWTELESIADVSLDLGPGLEPVGAAAEARREMNAFSKPLDGVFRWDGVTEEPALYLSWSDGGIVREERLVLVVPQARHRRPRLHATGLRPARWRDPRLHAAKHVAGQGSS